MPDCLSCPTSTQPNSAASAAIGVVGRQENRAEVALPPELVALRQSHN
jgi:hypothetical protein